MRWTILFLPHGFLADLVCPYVGHFITRKHLQFDPGHDFSRRL
jgi:hypothetical protein